MNLHILYVFNALYNMFTQILQRKHVLLHYYLGGIHMALSNEDTKIFTHHLAIARKKMHLTQFKCAELLDYSESFYKDIEYGRSSPSIEGLYTICRKLNMSADECIFQNTHNQSLTYHELLRLLSFCDEDMLKVLAATAEALILTKEKPSSPSENNNFPI